MLIEYRTSSLYKDASSSKFRIIKPVLWQLPNLGAEASAQADTSISKFASLGYARGSSPNSESISCLYEMRCIPFASNLDSSSSEL